MFIFYIRIFSSHLKLPQSSSSPFPFMIAGLFKDIGECYNRFGLIDVESDLEVLRTHSFDWTLRTGHL